MKASTYYAILGIGIIAVVGIVWWASTKHHPIPEHAPKNTPTQSEELASSTAPTLTGLSIFASGVYGFSIFYPAKDHVQTTFDTHYVLPNTWRVDALPNATGTPVFEIVGYSVQNQASFPRYFEAEVRIGVSKDPAELAACEKAGNGETQLPNATFGKTTWDAFSFSDAAMMQYIKGTSYRTIHDGSCYALEELETGSSYTDNTTVETPAEDATLAAQYTNLQQIVQTFTFAKP